ASVERVFCASGNPGIMPSAHILPLEPTDIGGIAQFAEEQQINLTVVGPEDPLALGIADEFERRGLKIFGPSKAAAQLEASKSFAKSIMNEAGVPTAASAVFDDPDEARRFVREHERAMVVKADGLALGKGVVMCADADTAFTAIGDAMERKLFGAAGERIVIEEWLRGEEASFFALCDGDNAVPIGLVQDHKQIFDGDRGPNTGGMGAYSPLPQFGDSLEARIMDEVVRPTLKAMKARGTPFRGVLFVGLMIDGERLDVLEFNVRFGDPECEALMMRFEGDLGQLLLDAARGDIARSQIKLSPESAVAVVLASGGYPGAYQKRIPIRKIEIAERLEGVRVFHSGTAIRNGNLVTDGGRVLVVCAKARNLTEAAAQAYRAADLIEFEGKHLRRDIGSKALKRFQAGVKPNAIQDA
ncbi:MAG TPA: phosphoribosylamine--glycine ligase, partial [Candidatus Binataceae bacterium]|nr:phosphoribosylamine--glycine ligase [Candidatus Binataceae bacterium]